MTIRMKTDRVELRISEDDLKRWREEAERRGLTLSAWLRMIADRAANARRAA